MLQRALLCCALLAAMAGRRSTAAAVDPDVVLAAYRRVFTMATNVELTAFGEAPAYAFEQLRVLLPPAQGTTANATAVSWPAAEDVLGATRALEDRDLLMVMFKALAGHFVTGPAALRPATCIVQADPRTGALRVSSNEVNTETVLGVLCILLLLVVLGLVFRLERGA